MANGPIDESKPVRISELVLLAFVFGLAALFLQLSDLVAFLLCALGFGLAIIALRQSFKTGSTGAWTPIFAIMICSLSVPRLPLYQMIDLIMPAPKRPHIPSVETIMTAPQQAKVDEYMAVENTVKLGDVSIEIKSVTLGNVEVEDFIWKTTSTSKEPYLSFAICITNESQTKKIDFRSWCGHAYDFRDGVKLTDNFGNSYKQIGVAATERPVGGDGSDSLYPEKSLQDVVIFEPPVNAVTELRLELPAHNADEEGTFKIRIPITMIQRN